MSGQYGIHHGVPAEDYLLFHATHQDALKGTFANATLPPRRTSDDGWDPRDDGHATFFSQPQEWVNRPIVNGGQTIDRGGVAAASRTRQWEEFDNYAEEVIRGVPLPALRRDGEITRDMEGGARGSTGAFAAVDAGGRPQAPSYSVDDETSQKTAAFPSLQALQRLEQLSRAPVLSAEEVTDALQEAEKLMPSAGRIGKAPLQSFAADVAKRRHAEPLSTEVEMTTPATDSGARARGSVPAPPPPSSRQSAETVPSWMWTPSSIPLGSGAEDPHQGAAAVAQWYQVYYAWLLYYQQLNAVQQSGNRHRHRHRGRSKKKGSTSISAAPRESMNAIEKPAEPAARRGMVAARPPRLTGAQSCSRTDPQDWMSFDAYRGHKGDLNFTSSAHERQPASSEEVEASHLVDVVEDLRNEYEVLSQEVSRLRQAMQSTSSENPPQRYAGRNLSKDVATGPSQRQRPMMRGNRSTSQKQSSGALTWQSLSESQRLFHAGKRSDQNGHADRYPPWRH